jgi:hypothetical protein
VKKHAIISQDRLGTNVQYNERTADADLTPSRTVRVVIPADRFLWCAEGEIVASFADVDGHDVVIGLCVRPTIPAPVNI